MMSERSELGRGVIFSAIHFREYDKVAKFTAFPWCNLHNPETEAGSRFLKRMEHDHRLIREFLGNDYIKGTHIVTTDKLWWIEQDYYPQSPVSSSNPQLLTVRDRLEELAVKNKRMLSDTGFSLDWHGFTFWGQLGKTVVDGNFWTFPSLTITECESRPEIRILDTSLIWTKTRNETDVLVLPHEYMAWKLNEIGLGMVQDRIGINFLGNKLLQKK